MGFDRDEIVDGALDGCGAEDDATNDDLAFAMTKDSNSPNRRWQNQLCGRETRVL